MTDVFVERSWDVPVKGAELAAMFEAARECLATHRCEWQGSFLSVDAKELFCHFVGPDAESLRVALHQPGSPRARVWSGTIHDAPGCSAADEPGANVLVTRRFEAATAFEDAGGGSLATPGVRLVRSWFSTDGKRMLCLYRAPGVEAVRTAQRQAAMPVERVLSVRALHG